MEYNDTLKWLKSYKILHDKLIYINNRIKGVQAISYDDGSGTGKSLNELIDEKTKVIQQMEEIEDTIDRIEDKYTNMVIGYRYLLFMSVEEISGEMEKSESWVKNRTKEGIKQIIIDIGQREGFVRF